MKTKRILILIVAFTSLLSFNLKQQPLIYPNYFPEPVYNYKTKPLDSITVELGRKLFYDPVLSADNSTSCASCHSPYNAFAHTDHNLSHGINNQLGNRNAPALFNLAWQNSFMWDGAANNLEEQALAPIIHPKEMGSNMEEVVKKLNAAEVYKKLFSDAYGSNKITSEKVLQALTQFQLTLISATAKYDKVKQGKENFTLEEQIGYNLFLQNCNNCHTEPLFSNYKFANNGLTTDTTLNDFGRWMITKKSADSLMFKTPSLRNLKYSYPYMHDGRFKTVKQVVDYYMRDIKQYKNLSAPLRTPIILSPVDKINLIAFLNTLNDEEFILNTKHQYSR
ncbi:cytochrome-c peroxidase [Ferruginibacter profundus]